MKETHISYATAKALKEFLGDSAVSPMADHIGLIAFYDGENPDDGILTGRELDGLIPAYTLADILSNEFCHVFSKKANTPDDAKGLSSLLACKYFYGGISLVECELMRMILGGA